MTKEYREACEFWDAVLPPDLIADVSRRDFDRLNWLDDNLSRLQEVYSLCVDKHESIRGAIDALAGKR